MNLENSLLYCTSWRDKITEEMLSSGVLLTEVWWDTRCLRCFTVCLEYKLLTFQGLTVGKIINSIYIHVLQKKCISFFADTISQFVIGQQCQVMFPFPVAILPVSTPSTIKTFTSFRVSVGLPAHTWLQLCLMCCLTWLLFIVAYQRKRAVSGNSDTDVHILHRGSLPSPINFGIWAHMAK